MSRRTQDTSRAFNSVVYRTITSYGRSFQIVPLPLFVSYRSPTTPDKSGLGSSPFARRYLGNRFFFLFLRVLRCFSSPGLPLLKLCIHLRVTSIDVGFPHSDIFGSTLTYSSPKHFGVCSVLHRLLVPRHPPCALHYLIVMNCEGEFPLLRACLFFELYCSRFLRLKSYIFNIFFTFLSSFQCANFESSLKTIQN